MIKRPMLPYYGSKWRMARHYAPPIYGQIVEPFAGGAGYALRWPDRQVKLVDLDPVLCGVWAYLIATPSAEILRLPIITAEETVDDHAWPCEEAKHLVGYWLAPGQGYPNRALSSWGRRYPCNSFWTEATRAAIAANVEQIRHWRIIHGDYTQAVEGEATYFVDPPYTGRPGESYRCDNRAIDYEQLGEWCRGLMGQVIVCEAHGADWLPFDALRAQHGIRGKSMEAVCYLGERGGQQQLLMGVG